MTAFLTQEAFRQGATRAFLLAGKQASRVYERVGFLPSATLMVYEASPSSVRSWYLLDRRMNIPGVTGLTEAQKAPHKATRALCAFLSS